MHAAGEIGEGHPRIRRAALALAAEQQHVVHAVAGRCRVDGERHVVPALGRAQGGFGRAQGAQGGGVGLQGPGGALVGAHEQPDRVECRSGWRRCRSRGGADRDVEDLDPAALRRRGRGGQVEHDLVQRYPGHRAQRRGDRGCVRVEDLGPVLATVRGLVHALLVDPGVEDPVSYRRRAVQDEGAGVPGVAAGAEGPVQAAVGGPPHPRLGGGIDHRRVRRVDDDRVDGRSDERRCRVARVVGRVAGAEQHPGCPAVGRLEQAHSERVVRRESPGARGGVDDVRVVRVDGHPGRLADGQ